MHVCGKSLSAVCVVQVWWTRHVTEEINVIFSFYFYFFHNCIVPVAFLPWEIRVAFPQGKSAATESRYPTYGAPRVF